MKKCSNPNCESSFLFGNDKTVCPFCHSRLEDSSETVGGRYISNIDREDFFPEQNQTDEFISRHFGKIKCHGRIAEIEHQELFYSVRHKVCNTIFRGEPYQFAHQTLEYTIRLENITDGFSSEVTDFCLYGSYLGRLQVGDEVVIKGRDLGDKKIAETIYNQTISSRVRPGLQISASVFRMMSGVLAFLILAFICQFVQLFQSGVIQRGFAAFVVGMIPWLLLGAGGWFLFRRIFPRRRRRR